MIKLVLFNTYDKYQYSILLNFKNIEEYNTYKKTVEFYDLIIDLKNTFGRISTLYDEEYGTSINGVPYVRCVFNQKNDLKNDFKKMVIMWKRFLYNKGKIFMSKKTAKDVDLNKIKLSLKFDFKKENTVQVKIILVKEDFLKKENYGIYRDYKTDFSVWSFGEFLFDDRQLRLPDIRNVSENLSSSFKFENEQKVKETLKKLYTTLHHWSNINSDFRDQGEVIMDEEYWYVL